jgi:hypothetical protein
MHPRATRFSLDAPVRFRGIGDSSWRAGTTVNASRSGVLLKSGGARLGLRDRVEFILTLPRVEGAHAGVEVRCTGDVARFEGGAAPSELGEATFALTIDDEDFGRSERERLTAFSQAGQNDV